MKLLEPGKNLPIHKIGLEERDMAKTDTVSKSAAKNREINNTAPNVAQNTYANAKDFVQTTYENVKDVAQTALGNAQGSVQSRAKKASQGIAQVTSGAQDLRDSVQDRYASYQRRRQRARTLFRWGLVIGIVLALLYTPVPGEEVRRRIGEQWEQYKGYMGL